MMPEIGGEVTMKELRGQEVDDVSPVVLDGFLETL